TLLANTAPEAKDATARVVTAVDTPAQRLTAAALVVLAIHELPSPGDDLLEQAEQLCQFLRRQQQADNPSPAVALYAVARSQRLRPADWKPADVAKGVNYWQKRWNGDADYQALPYLAVAAADPAAGGKNADFVHSLCEWTCKQQIGLDPQHPLWQ